jgi:hypothetical protein
MLTQLNHTEELNIPHVLSASFKCHSGQKKKEKKLSAFLCQICVQSFCFLNLFILYESNFSKCLLKYHRSTIELTKLRTSIIAFNFLFSNNDDKQVIIQ